MVLCHDSYSVIDMRFVERYDELVLRVRNPWGKGEWTGRFSDLDISKDPEMAKVMMEEFSTVSLEEGGVTDAEPYVLSPPWLCVRGGGGASTTYDGPTHVLWCALFVAAVGMAPIRMTALS